MSGINLLSFEVVLGTILLFGAIVGTFTELITNLLRRKNQR